MTTDDDEWKRPCLIPAADGDVGEELVDEEVLGQLEEVGLVVAPLEDVLLLQLRKQNQSRGHNRTNSLITRSTVYKKHLIRNIVEILRKIGNKD